MNWGDWEQKRQGKGEPAAFYGRVSTARQAEDDRHSLPVQIDFAQKEVEVLDIPHLRGFVDAGKSGTRWDNRKVEKIQQLVKEGKIKHIIVFDVSRLGRDAPAVIGFFCVCLKMGVKIVTPQMTYDGNQNSIIMFVFNALSSYSSNADRTKASIASKQKSFQLGNWNKCAIPFGYRRCANG